MALYIAASADNPYDGVGMAELYTAAFGCRAFVLATPDNDVVVELPEGARADVAQAWCNGFVAAHVDGTMWEGTWDVYEE